MMTHKDVAPAVKAVPELAERDHKTLTAIAESLARGSLPAVAADFKWRGSPCDTEALAQRLQVLEIQPVEIVDVHAVPRDAGSMLSAVVEGFSGIALSKDMCLGIITVRFRAHTITWGLIIDGGDALAAWFDPSALLQVIAPAA